MSGYEAAFFYNTTTARPDRTKPPSAHTNISKHSQAKPITHDFRKNRSRRARANDEDSSSAGSKGSISSPPSSVKTSPCTTTSLGAGCMNPPPTPNFKTGNSTFPPAQSSLPLSSSTTHHTLQSLSPGHGATDRKNAAQAGPPSTPGVYHPRPVESQPQSLSGTSDSGSSALTTITSSDPPGTDAFMTQPFARRYGRRYLRDSTLPYPLPCDLAETHRQTLRTMLLCQIFSTPVCAPVFQETPPKKVLEVGCGSGYWSALCHEYFSKRGSPSISFTGLDIAPLALPMDKSGDMDWRFVQHDLRRLPLPFADGEFDLLMLKDISIAIPQSDRIQQVLTDEYIRILSPGGVLEVWEGDHKIRLLMAHSTRTTAEDSDDSDDSEDEDQEHANATGTYILTPQTPIKSAQNQYIIDYNLWLSRAFDSRNLSSIPCTLIRPWLIQESESLTAIDSRRLAIPLGEVRWEREGIGSDAAMKKGKAALKDSDRRVLTVGQAAVRRTALMTFVQMVQSLEPLLKQASGKGQDEWDRWYAGMMTDLLKGNGTSFGECLEVGAWWARKRKGA